MSRPKQQSKNRPRKPASLSLRSKNPASHCFQLWGTKTQTTYQQTAALGKKMCSGLFLLVFRGFDGCLSYFYTKNTTTNLFAFWSPGVCAFDHCPRSSFRSRARRWSHLVVSKFLRMFLEKHPFESALFFHKKLFV